MAGRPSRWASAHILLSVVIFVCDYWKLFFFTDHPSLSHGARSAVLAGEYAAGAGSETESSDLDDDDSVLSESSLVAAEKDVLPDFTANLLCSHAPGLAISSILTSAIYTFQSSSHA